MAILLSVSLHPTLISQETGTNWVGRSERTENDGDLDLIAPPVPTASARHKMDGYETDG